jgi:hypothetical protein
MQLTPEYAIVAQQGDQIHGVQLRRVPDFVVVAHTADNPPAGSAAAMRSRAETRSFMRRPALAAA